MLRFFLYAIFLGSAVSPGWTQVSDSTNGWRYKYDSLKIDLNRWRQSPYVRVDSIGASVQNRALWMLSITNGDETGKQRVFIHARTHPAEVQAFYVTREMIRFLLDTTAASNQIRNQFIFQIIPMYNPDGVELGYGRLNAHRVDIESNWDKTTLEPEVIALRAKFDELRAKPNPPRVALNMHADQVNCTRFFFYHDPSATSQAYGTLEQNYITGVRSYFTEGIQPWNYLVSWSDGFKTQYPESYWWQRSGAAVMALTYEDTNCPTAGQFDRTGRALVLGTVDYVNGHPTALARLDRDAMLHSSVPDRSGPVFIYSQHGNVNYFDVAGRVRRSLPSPQQ
jgi:hypothetical protein